MNSSLDEPVVGKKNLREVITQANDPNSTDRTITFDQAIHGSTTYLNDMLPEITQNITIDGTGADIELFRNEMLQPFRLMQVHQDVTATVKGLTFGYGEAPAGESGGAIRSYGSLVLDSTIFEYNEAHFSLGSGGLGGAIHIPLPGTLSVSNSSFYLNNAYRGGAISILNPASSNWINNSEFAGNTAEDQGGAIALLGVQNDPMYVAVTHSVFTDNWAGNRGGAIYAYGVGLLLEEGTDINNNGTYNASGEGGGVYISGGGSITYDGVTFSYNSATTGNGAWLGNTVGRFEGEGSVTWEGNQEFLQP